MPETNQYSTTAQSGKTPATNATAQPGKTPATNATAQPGKTPATNATASPTPIPKAPNWSDRHRQHLAKLEPNMAAKWIADNADETETQVKALIQRAFKYAFYAGAGCNHSLNEHGV
jgi:hypothetical protein